MDGKPTRAAIYARVSTNEQTAENQLLDLRRYATERGWTEEEFVDTGISGTVASRPALDRLMNAVKKRQVDVVLVWRFDRFARSVKHLLLTLEELRALGIGFVSFQENVDTSSPLGQAIFTIIAAMAQLERDLIVDRVKAGLRRAKAQGKTLGRPKAIVDADHVRILRKQGQSFAEIASRLKISKATAHRIARELGSDSGETKSATV